MTLIANPGRVVSVPLKPAFVLMANNAKVTQIAHLGIIVSVVLKPAFVLAS